MFVARLTDTIDLFYFNSHALIFYPFVILCIIIDVLISNFVHLSIWYVELELDVVEDVVVELFSSVAESTIWRWFLMVFLIWRWFHRNFLFFSIFFVFVIIYLYYVYFVIVFLCLNIWGMQDSLLVLLLKLGVACVFYGCFICASSSSPCHFGLMRGDSISLQGSLILFPSNPHNFCC